MYTQFPKNAGAKNVILSLLSKIEPVSISESNLHIQKALGQHRSEGDPTCGQALRLGLVMNWL
jgi:hypothetical protein